MRNLVIAEDFWTCNSWDLKYKARIGMVLVDSHYRCWKITGVRDLGVTGPFWERVLRFVLRQSLHKVSCDICEIDALSLDLLIERVCAAITSLPDYWIDDDGPPREVHEMLDDLQAEVRKTQSVEQIIDTLWPD